MYLYLGGKNWYISNNSIYFSGKNWYISIYKNRRYKQKVNILKWLKNEVVYFICKLKSQNIYDYKLFKYYTTSYYIKSYKTLVYNYGFRGI